MHSVYFLLIALLAHLTQAQPGFHKKSTHLSSHGSRNTVLQRAGVIINAVRNENSDNGNGRLLNSKYRIERNIGSGGQGEIYEAIDITREDLGKVAIKVADSGLSSFFIAKEAEILRKVIGIANVIPILDEFQFKDRTCIVLPLRDGNLERYLVMRANFQHNWNRPELRLDFAWFQKFTSSLTRTLVEIHRKGFVHNDIKPQNILYHGTFEDPYFELADFGGAAKLWSLFCIGTRKYLPPEFGNECLRMLTPRREHHDMFALCVTIMHAFTSGRFDATSAEDPMKLLSVAYHPSYT
jgi:serine/threonine protein kinase